MTVPFDVRLHHPQPAQAPARAAAKCERHPEQSFTGFCSSCLRERLAGFEPASSSCAASFLPELRRCRSYSGAGGAPPAAVMEPKRRSCDVRIRSTLLSLFYLDEDPNVCSVTRSSAARGDPDIESRNLGFAAPLPEDEEEEEFRDAEEDLLDGEGLRPIKDLIDMESKTKGPAKSTAVDFGGSFWLAASVFGKKLQIWRRKKPETAIRGGKKSTSQLELYENIPGRLSLDVGRTSVDGPRYSLDEARASWDGYTARSTSRHLPPRQSSSMLSVGEQILRRPDAQIPVDEHSIPGGTAQTRAYYSETQPQRRRRSFDRSSSARRSSVDGDDDNDLPLKPPSISRISPALHEYFHQVRSVEREEFTICNRGKQEKSGLWSKGWSLRGLIQPKRESEKPFPGEFPEKKRESFHRSSTSSDVGSRCSTDRRKDKERKRAPAITHSLANDLLRLY